jgi:RNA polymerase sigma-70 factor (ECF subfamily)
MKVSMVERDPTELLVERARAGERSAFDRLIERYRTRLHAGVEMQIQRLERSSLEAEEILQETLAQALQSLDRFQWRGEDSFYLWLCGIARNVIFKVTRKSRQQRLLQLPEHIRASSPSPSKALRREERFDRLERAFAGLKPEYREVLRLSRLEGLKVKEIAARMKRSENAVRHLMARAVIELKNSFGDTESLHLPDRAFRVEEESRGKE